MLLDRNAAGPSWWSRLSSPSGAAGLQAAKGTPLPPAYHAVGFRLVRWPDLPGMVRTANLLRALSVMTQRPVTVAWLARQMAWSPEQAQLFLQGLADQGDAQCVGVLSSTAAPTAR